MQDAEAGNRAARTGATPPDPGRLRTSGSGAGYRHNSTGPEDANSQQFPRVANPHEARDRPSFEISPTIVHAPDPVRLAVADPPGSELTRNTPVWEPDVVGANVTVRVCEDPGGSEKPSGLTVNGGVV